MKQGTYTDGGKELQNESVGWNHGLAAVIGALIKQNLTLNYFQEYNYSPYNCFKNTIEVETQKFQIKGVKGKIPMLYSLVITK